MSVHVVAAGGVILPHASWSAGGRTTMDQPVRAAFPDIHIEILELVAENDTVES